MYVVCILTWHKHLIICLLLESTNSLVEEMALFKALKTTVHVGTLGNKI